MLFSVAVLGRSEGAMAIAGGMMMTASRFTVWLLAGLFALGSNVALAAGDAEKGKKVFNKCKACHFVDKDKNKVGPHLVGIFGRSAGSVEGFKYSDTMKESGIVWDEASMDEYLTDPKAMVPKGKMAFVGLKKEEDRADVIAYLMEATAQ